ncbi:hypothetical protein [uncultured Aquitalea sp.]|uniref:hypothetical protein n=1 Tax=uncultured Aquitalea sp. TaxID=540272 RepID=UPI0025FBE15A|nr:hypothetical protein [uncultured Aquitalea sp.]
MSKILLAGALALCAAQTFAADVGISIQIGEPGFYGQLDLGDIVPLVINPHPVIISPVVVQQPPLYLRVPPGHIHDWRRYCGRYHACDRPVYFVQDQWYRNEYAPRYRQEHAERFGKHEEHRDDQRHHEQDHHGDHRDNGGEQHDQPRWPDQRN